MNESLELRNRILKMRESNNLVLDKVQAERKKLVSDTDFIVQKIESKSDKEEENFTNNKDNLNLKPQKEDISHTMERKKVVDSNLFKNNSVNTKINYEKNKAKEISNNLVNDNEAQFRIIANKFNEAVEVILELSEKVKKLEGIVNNLPVNYVKNKKNKSFFNLKNSVLFTITILFIIGIFTLSIDLSLVKLIITDIISSI